MPIPNVVSVRSQANYKEEELKARKADPKSGRVLRAFLNACAQLNSRVILCRHHQCGIAVSSQLIFEALYCKTPSCQAAYLVSGVACV